MKRTLTFLLLLGVASGCRFMSSNSSDTKPITAKNPVEQLVALCKEDNYREAAKHMRYSGRDNAKRDHAANYDSGDPDEKRGIERECGRFKTMANMGYTVSPERMEQGFYVYDVEVKEGSKTHKQLWAFRKSGNDYVLVDID